MEENQLNLDVDYSDMLSICPQALDFYTKNGMTELMHPYTIANILGTNQFYAEAAFFYKIAFNMHSKDAGQFPLAHFLLMARLVALLKGNFPIKEEEMEQLKGICIPLYNYVAGWRLYKESGNALAALQLMGNCFEELHTGEETDTIYLTVMMDLFNPNQEVCIKNRAFGVADFNVIPNNLFMYWDQNPPEEIQKNFEYHKTLSHFNLKIFNKEEATEWLYQNYGVEARQLFLNARHPAEAADFLRVHVINYYGGWWLDADIKIQSVEQFFSIIPSTYEHVFLLTHNNVVHNDFFGSVPNSPILNDCLLSLYRNSYLHTGLFIAYKTGPGVFSRAINRVFYRYLRGEAKKPSVVLLDDRKFWSVIFDFDTPYKNSTQHWMAS